jgi:Ca-activated chloride channel family protein
MIEDQSTAIGMGLATGVSRLKDSKAKSKVIILLTDGVNNSGFISPATASEIAKKFNIRVYTVGVGSYGKAPYPFNGPFGVQYQEIEVKIDEGVLKQIAQETGGKYFRANTKNKLKTIYDEIDKMEKTELESIAYQRYEEKYFLFLLIGSLLLFAELFFRSIVLKGIYA